MAASPKYKVYDHTGEYVAACKHPCHAGMLIAALGNGASIRTGHRTQDIVWLEGAEEQPANESYDFVTSTVHYRETDTF